MEHKMGFQNTDTGFHLTFENGYTISVQWGRMNYCHARGDSDNLYKDLDNSADYSRTAEIAAWNPEGKFMHLSEYDDVVGWLSSDEVAQYITVLSGSEPEKAIYLSWPEGRFKSTKDTVTSWLGL